VKLPPEEKRLVVPLSLDQVDAVAEVIGTQYRPLVILGTGAGLRIGEGLGLPVSAIDFLGRQLAVTQQTVTVRKVTTIAVPKTAASVRTVPLADSVLTELSSCIQARPRFPGPLLVWDANGDPIPQNRFSTSWARAVARAGLPTGTRFHDLRHTYSSALISSGCSAKAVQAALGHKSAAITLNTYAHLWPSDEDRTRAAVEAFFAPGSSTSRVQSVSS
jgi:integrase